MEGWEHSAIAGQHFHLPLTKSVLNFAEVQTDRCIALSFHAAHRVLGQRLLDKFQYFIHSTTSVKVRKTEQSRRQIRLTWNERMRSKWIFG